MSNDTQAIVGVVSDVAVIEEWRSIPDFSFYEASNTGHIRYVGPAERNKGKVLFELTKPTSVGSYLRVNAVSDSHESNSADVHQLVCRAFHGMPPLDGNKYEVNHKDGNKHNNAETNLEWMTRSQNLIHAYQTGLRTDNTPVLVYDDETGETTRYYAMGEFARAWNITKNEAATLLSKHRVKKYQNRYLFDTDHSNRKVNNHSWVRDIRAKDYVTGRFILATDTRSLERTIDIQRGTILWNLRNGLTKLVGGYVFKYMDDATPFPEYTIEQATASREAYLAKEAPKKKQHGVQVRDYTTGSITDYPTFSEAAEATHTVKGTIVYLLAQSELKLFRGRVFKYKVDPRPFPEYSDEKIEISRWVKKPDLPAARVTDTHLNTTKLYPSMAEFAKEIGANPVSVSNWVKEHPDRPYRNRFAIVRVVL